MHGVGRIAIAATVSLALASAAQATTPEQCGDADLNGARTVTDGVLVLRTAAALTGGCSVASRCDVDGNGQVSVTDGVLALRLAAELAVDLHCRNAVVDRSQFFFFGFNRRSAFGFCPPLDSISQVMLNHGPAGVTRTAKVIVAGNPGEADCDPAIMPVPVVACAKEVSLPDRLLTADEVARVEAAFSAITREQQRAPDCARVTFQPCVIDEFVWDTSTITDFVCGEPRLLPDQSQALIDVLESLR